MYRFLLPLGIVVFGIPAFAQTNVPLGSPASAPLSRAGKAIEPIAPLRLQDALSMAFANNSDLQAAQYELQAVDGAVIQAGAMPNPVLEMSVEDRRRETRETTIQMSQPIELGGKRGARIRAAERGRDAATAELNAKRADVRATVITAFFEVLIAQERVRLAQESVELAQRGTSVASRRVIAGKVSPVEETKARVAEANVRLEMNQAKSELTSARKRLAATWGNPTPRFERADGQLDALPALPALPALANRMTTAPALIRARSEVERRDALTQLESSRRIPDVTVSMGMKRSEELGRNQAIVGISFPLPLFDSNRGNVLEASRRSDKAREELVATELRLDGELSQAHERLTTALLEIESLQKDILPGAQSAHDAATKGFEYGKFSFLDVLDAQRTLLLAKSQYLRALSEAHRAAADIERLLGEPSSIIK